LSLLYSRRLKKIFNMITDVTYFWTVVTLFPNFKIAYCNNFNFNSILKTSATLKYSCGCCLMWSLITLSISLLPKTLWQYYSQPRKKYILLLKSFGYCNQISLVQSDPIKQPLIYEYLVFILLLFLGSKLF